MIIIHKISPGFDSSKLNNATFEDKVDVFEDRMKGWMLDWADHLNQQEHAGFAVLHLALSYFESIAIFLKGEESMNRRSTDLFKFSFYEVFEEDCNKWGSARSEKVARLMYKQGRCGFYHSGMAKKEIGLQNGDLFTINEKNGILDSVNIDRHKFMGAIRIHLDNYIGKLRSQNEQELTDNFISGWDIFHS